MVWPWLALLGGAAIYNAVRYAWSGSEPPAPSKRRERPSKMEALLDKGYERPTDRYESEEPEFDRPQPAYFPSFKMLAEKIAVPLYEVTLDICLHLGWSDIQGKPLYWFDHDGITWEVNSNTHLLPLMLAYLWQKEHKGRNPFAVKAGAGKRRTLELRPEIGWTGPKHLYIYEPVNPIPPKWRGTR